MLNEILDVIEVLVFSPSEPVASIRTILLLVALGWLLTRLLSRWFEEKPAGRGGGGGEGKPEKPPQQPKGGGGKQEQPKPQPKGGGGGGGGSYRPGLLEQLLGGIGDGIGQTLRGLGSGLGSALQGLGSGIGSMRGSGGRSSGSMYLGGPQAHSNPGRWSGVAAGFGLGLGLGAAGARAAAGWTKQAATSARDAFQAWQAQREWDAWHSQGAPAYGWRVDDPAAQQAVAGAFNEAGIRYAWQQDETGAWQVVVNAEDVALAQEALSGAGLEFQEPGAPLGVDGQPWEPGVNDLPDDETQEQQADTASGETTVFDPETGQWIPVEPNAESPMDEQGMNNGWSSEPAMFTPDTWGDASDAGDSSGAIVMWGGE